MKIYDLAENMIRLSGVHLYGTPGKVEELKAICNRHGAVIVEDAAESLGATYKGVQTGTFNAISLLGNKSFTGNKTKKIA